MRDVVGGIHYAAVQTELGRAEWWFYLQSDSVLLKRYNQQSQQFEDTNHPEALRAIESVKTGCTSGLKPYEQAEAISWYMLTSNIREKYFPLRLHCATPAEPSLAFEAELNQTHQGDKSAFITEFEYSYVKWLVSPSEEPDEEAISRWRYLTEAVSQAEIDYLITEEKICRAVAVSISWQLEGGYRRHTDKEDPVVESAMRLAEKMIRSGDEELMRRGQEVKDTVEKLKLGTIPLLPAITEKYPPDEEDEDDYEDEDDDE